jgi:hypothetical protein
MNFIRIVTAGALALALSASGAFAATKAEKQAEVRKVAATSLQEFYKADPKLKERVENARRINALCFVPDGSCAGRARRFGGRER